MISYRRAVVYAAIFFFIIFHLYTHRGSPDTGSSFPKQPATAAAKTPATTTGKDTGVKDTAATAAAAPVEEAGKPAVSSQKRPQQHLSIEEIKQLPLDKQLAYQFPYDVSERFPTFIWQTWKYTPASGMFADNFRVCEASWTEKHPTFVHEVITDEVAVHLMRHLYSGVPDVLEAYLAMPLPILKADFFRYLILLARGGIYTDIDTFAIKSAPEWVSSGFRTNPFGLVIGIEADPDRPDWKQWYSRRIQFCQWTIQAKAGHPVLRNIVVHITRETLKRKKEGRLTHNHDQVVDWTGPAPWTDAVFQYFNDPEYFDMEHSKKNITFEEFTGMKQPKQVGDVVVLPITAFSPGVGHSGAGEEDDPMACVKHEFEGTWKPENERIKDVVEKQGPKPEAQKKHEEQAQKQG